MYIWALVSLSMVWGCCASKPGCCMPNKFEATELLTVGTCSSGQEKCEASHSEGYLRVSLDATRKMTNTYGVINSGGRLETVRVIQDFTKKKEYILNKDGSKCSVSNLPHDWIPPCVPADSKKLMSSYVGIQPGSKYDVDLYRTNAPPGLMGGANGMQVFVSVAAADCTIVAESISHKDGSGFAMNIYVYNTTRGIKDPSVFDIPASCSHTLIDEPIFRYKSAFLP